MPDATRPRGVDYFAFDGVLFSGTEFPPGGGPNAFDWQVHADKGIRFAFLKASQGTTDAGNGAWITLNYPLVKSAGILRSPYHWLIPCVNAQPAGTLTSANWRQTPVAGNPLDLALQQANNFVAQILALGWGEPGDLPPAVDIEPTPLRDAAGNPLRATVVDAAGHAVFEDLTANHAQLGVIVGNNLQSPGGAVLGPLQLNAGVPVSFTDAAGVHPGRIRHEPTNLWELTGLGQQGAINVTVVWLARVESLLLASVPGRNAKPFIYSSTVWKEVLHSPGTSGGLGFTVNQGGNPFTVADFSVYPYWFAAYPGAGPQNPIRALSSTWATVDRKFIWQFDAGPQPANPGPDVNAIMKITAVNGADPVFKSVTVEEIDGFDSQSADGLAWIEDLANIKRPAAPAALTLISPPPIDPDPARSFNILFIGQGFDPAEFQAVAQRAWNNVANHTQSIADTDAFSALQRPSRVACYADSGNGVFLRMRQTASKVPNLDDALTIPPDAATVLRDYLPLLKIVWGPANTETTADKIWLQRRQRGPTGTLIAVLRNGRLPARNLPAAPPQQQPAELYQLDPSDNYPVPLVAVNVTWNDELWPMVVVRALAQNLAGLADEFSLPGDGFDHPDPERIPPNAPNLLFLDAGGNGLVAGDPVPDDFATRALTTWRLPVDADTKKNLDFPAAGAPPAALGGVHLLPGGDGYRNLVLHSDSDCLMQRVPVTVALAGVNPGAQPIRTAGVQFCRVCKEWLQAVVAGKQQFTAGDIINLGTQSPLCDRISWNKVEQPAAGFNPKRAFNRVHTMNVPDGEPAWSMTIDYNPAAVTVANLFRITNVQLAKRPGDPFAASTNVLASLNFGELIATFSHRETKAGALKNVVQNLDAVLASAINNTLDPPTLELASDGGSGRAFQLGVRLRLSWPFSFPWLGTPRKLFAVEAVLGLVLSGERPVDSVFPVQGCVILPQLALRVRRASGLLSTGQPRNTVANDTAATVSDLSGAVHFDAVNAIAAAAGLDASLAPLASGQLGASLVCSSNTALGDTTLAKVDNTTQVLLPASGRKLAAMRVNGHGFEPFTVGPPAWSWRYDYMRTSLAAKTTVAGAYRDNEPKGATTPAGARQGNFTWPSGSPFAFNLFKNPRQGDYDALVIHPVESAAPSVALPVSANLGLVLRLRQGLSEVVNLLGLPSAGWGPGRLDAGAGTSLAAPLCPSNQHVDLVIEKPAAGTVRVTYTSTAEEFRPDEWQVFMEQGISLGYRFALDTGSLAWLRMVAGYSGIPAATLTALAAAFADTANPAALDLQLRSLWLALNAAARLYDQTLDGTNVQQAPETGDVPGAEAK